MSRFNIISNKNYIVKMLIVVNTCDKIMIIIIFIVLIGTHSIHSIIITLHSLAQKEKKTIKTNGKKKKTLSK